MAVSEVDDSESDRPRAPRGPGRGAGIERPGGGGLAHHDPTLLVLLGLRLKGFAPLEAVAEVAKLPDEVVRGELEQARGRGWAAFREGRLTGWSLTPSGRVEGQRRLAEELDRAGVRRLVEDSYRRFLGLNGEVLEVCTRWQMKDPATPNDHRDPAYDAGVVEVLSTIHEQAEPICLTLAQGLARFEGYADRLAGALDRVRGGEVEWFTSVRLASYHSVWFELHENLLATLGIERGGQR